MDFSKHNLCKLIDLLKIEVFWKTVVPFSVIGVGMNGEKVNPSTSVDGIEAYGYDVLCKLMHIKTGRQ